MWVSPQLRQYRRDWAGERKLLNWEASYPLYYAAPRPHVVANKRYRSAIVLQAAWRARKGRQLAAQQRALTSAYGPRHLRIAKARRKTMAFRKSMMYRKRF